MIIAIASPENQTDDGISHMIMVNYVEINLCLINIYFMTAEPTTFDK